MRSILFKVPGIGIPVYGFGITLLLAFVLALALAGRNARRMRLPDGLVDDLALWVIVGGLLGARGFYVLQYWNRLELRSLLDFFKLWNGGIVLYGSLIGVVIAMAAYYKLRPFPFWATMDALAPAFALGAGIGRLGCFLNGCCFGDECRLPWAVRFPANSLPWAHQVERGSIATGAAWSLPVHPTQLYAFVDGIIICMLILSFIPLRKRDGEAFALLLIAYAITRFLIEQLRADEAIFLAGMTISQSISAVLLAVGCVLWFALKRLSATRFEDRGDLAAST
jgi:phosphatidylglycerol:prolipoprotein diacylglycerol transferase